MSEQDTRHLIKAQAAQGKSVERLRNRQRFRALGDFYASFENLPALRGLWTAASVDQTGMMYDRSGQLRHLTYTGNPTLDVYNNLVPYWNYDGTGDYHARPDEVGLDILGTETSIAAALRGLTMGGWFWFDNLSRQEWVMDKWSLNAAGTSYGVRKSTADLLAFFITDGVTQQSVSTAAVAAARWNFCVFRFDPSTEIAAFLNGTKTMFTTAVDASLANSASQFGIGAALNPAAEFLDGRCALAFLCGAILSDNLLDHLYTGSRVLFDA